MIQGANVGMGLNVVLRQNGDGREPVLHGLWLRSRRILSNRMLFKRM